MIKNCKICNSEFNNKIKINNIVRNCRGRANCFECVPFNSVLKIPSPNAPNRVCFLCNKNFYSPTLNKGGKIDGKKCHSCVSGIKKLKIKLLAIELLGGKCELCGWNEYPEGFDFHHKNQEEKEYDISEISYKKWDCIREEVIKCQLLCSLCHRKVHLNPKLEIYLNYINSTGK